MFASRNPRPTTIWNSGIQVAIEVGAQRPRRVESAPHTEGLHANLASEPLTDSRYVLATPMRPAVIEHPTRTPMTAV